MIKPTHAHVERKWQNKTQQLPAVKHARGHHKPKKPKHEGLAKHGAHRVAQRATCQLEAGPQVVRCKRLVSTVAVWMTHERAT